jgi:hypothetical protein
LSGSFAFCLWNVGYIEHFPTTESISEYIFGQYMTSAALALFFSAPKWFHVIYQELWFPLIQVKVVFHQQTIWSLCTSTSIPYPFWSRIVNKWAPLSLSTISSNVGTWKCFCFI